MDGNEPARLQGAGEALEVGDRGMPGRVEDTVGHLVLVEPVQDPPGTILLQIALPHGVGETGPVQNRLHAAIAHHHRPEQHDGPPGHETRQVLREDAAPAVPLQVVEELLPPDPHPLAVRKIQLHPGPAGLRDGAPARRFQYDGPW